MKNKNFENEELRNKAIKEFLKKPINKKLSEKIEKIQKYEDMVTRGGIEESCFNLTSCLYALYVWKCLTWAKNESNPSVTTPDMDFLMMQIIKDEDVNWEGFQEYIDTNGLSYNDDNLITIDECYFISKFDDRTQNFIKAIFLLDYIFQSVNPTFNTYITTVYDNNFHDCSDKVIEPPFIHNKLMFSKFIKNIWRSFDQKNMIAFDELIISPITCLGIELRYQDEPTKWEVFPTGLTLHLGMNNLWNKEEGMHAKEFKTQQFDYKQRINSLELEDKFTVHLKSPENKRPNLLDNFDYYLKAFDMKTFNTKPEEMNALLDFDLNTMDISSYIPEDYKKSYDILIKLIAKFANSNKKSK